MKRIYDARQIQGVYTDSMPAVEYDEVNNELSVLRTGVIVTHLCSLRCRLCAERTAYYEERYNPTLDYLKKEIDALFALVDYTMKFEITGGEPTLRKDLPDFLAYLLSYKKQFGRIRIITNGSIPLRKELIIVLKQYGTQADVLIDDYGDCLSIHAKANAELCAENGIIHILRKQSGNDHFGGWVDFGDMSRKHTDEMAKELFTKCAIPGKVGFSLRIKGGLLSPCAMTLQCIEFDVHQGTEDEYIDLFDRTMTKREQCAKILRIFEADCLSACAYCNGLCEDSVRYKPAEQLSKNNVRQRDE